MGRFKGSWDDPVAVTRLRAALFNYARSRARLTDNILEDFVQWALVRMWRNSNVFDFRFILADFFRENFGRQLTSGKPNPRFLAQFGNLPLESWHEPASDSDPYSTGEESRQLMRIARLNLTDDEFQLFFWHVAGFLNREIAVSLRQHPTRISQRLSAIRAKLAQIKRE